MGALSQLITWILIISAFWVTMITVHYLHKTTPQKLYVTRTLFRINVIFNNCFPQFAIKWEMRSVAVVPDQNMTIICHKEMSRRQFQGKTTAGRNKMPKHQKHANKNQRTSDGWLSILTKNISCLYYMYIILLHMS